MASCHQCGVNTMLQADPTKCANCGAPLAIRSLRETVEFDVEYHEPTTEEKRAQLRAALERMKAFHQSEGNTFTWEYTDTGANYYVNGEYDGHAIFEEAPEESLKNTETIYRTTQMKCPACQGPLNALRSEDGRDQAPIPGDRTICIHCTAVLIITEPGGLRAATQADIDALEEEERIELGTLLRNLRVSIQAGVPTRIEER